MKNIRTIQHAERARIEHDLVVERIGELTLRNIHALVRGTMYGSGAEAVGILSGFIASAAGGLNVSVSAPAIAVQNLSGSDVKYCIDANDDENWTIALDAAHASYTRYDIIEAAIRRRSALVDSAVDVIDPVTRVITPTTRNRDYEMYFTVRKKNGTAGASPVPPSPTAATSGTLIGTVAIPTTIDLSIKDILALAYGEDGEYVEVSCKGATPSATTKAEIVSAINTANIGITASLSGNYMVLTAAGTGENSVIKIRQPNDYSTDAFQAIFGVTTTLGYHLSYAGENAWFKVAEIRVQPGATVLTDAYVQTRFEKDSWLSDSSSVKNIYSMENHRELSILDHPDESIYYKHLNNDAKIKIASKKTLYRGVNAPVYPFSGDGTGRCGTVYKYSILTKTVNGDENLLVDTEQLYPVSRVDQKNETTSGTAYSLTTSLSESDKIITFTPSDPDLLPFSLQHNRVGFYVSSIGSGYTNIRVVLHNSSHYQVGSASILLASVIVGWNYVDIPVTLVEGEACHYHIYIEGFSSGSTPTLATNASAALAFREMYKPTAGKYGSLNFADIIKIINSSGTALVPVRSSGADVGYVGASGLDIMPVDFSNDATWLAWEYNGYVGVDLRTGRIKLPSGYNVANYYVEFNTSVLVEYLDTKMLYKHNSQQSLEDWLVANNTSISSEIDLDIATHAALTASHGVSGNIVGTTSTQTLTNKTLTSPTINDGTVNLDGGVFILPLAATPAQTANGSVVWDSDGFLLTVGTGSGRRTMVDAESAQTIPGLKTFGAIPLLPGSDPIANNEAARKGYVDGLISYDYIVDSQAKFNTLVASGTWLGAKNVLFKVNVTRTGQITIPGTVEKIHAINNAEITFTGITASQYCLGYATAPTTPNYEIIGLRINTSSSLDAATIYGFKNCINLKNCYASVTKTAGSGEAVGFWYCYRLTNCLGIGIGATNSGSGFRNCHQLINCEAPVYSGGYGFLYCFKLTNCKSEAVMSGEGCYNSCDQLTNCTGANNGAVIYANIGYAGFCTYTGTPAAAWGGTNLKIRGCQGVADIT